MQISGVSLTLLWPHRLCLLRALLCVNTTATSFPLSKHTGRGDTAPTFSGLCVCLQLMWEVGLTPSPMEFSSLCHSHKLSCSWLLGTCPNSHQNLSSQAQLIYLQFWEGFPSPLFGAQSTPRCLPCVFIVLFAYYSVSLFFPGWGSVCPGGYADLAQGCLWKYCILLSSPCPCLP
jgi:hypothetical protein